MPNAIFQHTEEHRVSANLSSCSQYFNSVQHCHTVVKVMGSGSGWGSAPSQPHLSFEPHLQLMTFHIRWRCVTVVRYVVLSNAVVINLFVVVTDSIRNNRVWADITNELH